MADDKDQNDEIEIENLEEEFDLDLFADEEQETAATDRVDPEITSAERQFDEEFERELDASPASGSEDDLSDDFTDTLDDDVIDISDEEVARELAAMEQEDVVAEPVPENPAGISDAAADDVEPSGSDDVYQDFTKEEFTAPDQYNAEASVMGKTEKQAGNNKIAGTKTGTIALPPFLASLASLSPRMIVAVTAAVLLPVVIFTVLGFNSDSSDAEVTGNADAAALAQDSADDPFLDAMDQPQAAEQPENVNMPGLTAEDIEPALAATRPDPADSAPENPASAAGLPEDKQLSADTIADRANDAETPSREQVSEPDSRALLAQADTESQQAGGDNQDNVLQNAGTETGESGAEVTESEESESEGSESEDNSSQTSPEATSASAEPAMSTDMDVPGTEEGRNYHIVVASFVSGNVAQQHAESISDNEISAYVIAPFGASSNYRVAVANYRSMAEARENIPGLRAIYGEGIWPLRYPPSPGVPLIAERTGDTYIIVASFPSEQLARSHARGLVERGEQPAIIAPYPPANRYRVAASYYDSTSNAEAALGQFRDNYGEDAWLLRY